MRGSRRSIWMTVVVILACIGEPSSARAGDKEEMLKELEALDDELDDLDKCYEKLEDFFKVSGEEWAKTVEEANKLEGQYPQRCQYGKTVQVPLVERQLKELTAKCSEDCFGEAQVKIVEGLAESLHDLKQVVEWNCEKAQAAQK